MSAHQDLRTAVAEVAQTLQATADLNNTLAECAETISRRLAFEIIAEATQQAAAEIQAALFVEADSVLAAPRPEQGSVLDAMAREIHSYTHTFTGLPYQDIPRMPALAIAVEALGAAEYILSDDAHVERMARTLCRADYPLQEDFDRYWKLLGKAHYVRLAAKAIAELLSGTPAGIDNGMVGSEDQVVNRLSLETDSEHYLRFVRKAIAVLFSGRPAE